MITENMDLKEIRKALGLELFLLRRQKGMSLFHMAHHIKIDRRVLDRVETGADLYPDADNQPLRQKSPHRTGGIKTKSPV